MREAGPAYKAGDLRIELFIDQPRRGQSRYEGRSQK